MSQSQSSQPLSEDEELQVAIALSLEDQRGTSAEDKAFEAEMNHYDRLKLNFGFETVWSLSSGILQADQMIFQDKPYVVKYKVIKEMGATMDDVTWETFTAVAENGSVKELWKAAESCYQQAKLAVGDWHYFIEDFDLQDDGTLQLVTGS